MKQTYMAKPVDIDPQWFVVDAEGRILGRLATKIATVLMGKHRPTYTPHIDTGDFVVVVNAEKVAVTGRKMESKTYDHNTGYPGGLVKIPLSDMLVKKPEEVVRMAVKRMLPKTKLGRKMFSKLKVYAGPDHPHAAQTPEPFEL